MPEERYERIASDIEYKEEGDLVADSKDLPFADASLSGVVYDPPYMHRSGDTVHSDHQNFESYYRNSTAEGVDSAKYHNAVLEEYFQTGREVYPTLKHEGVFIVKCQDEVCANIQRLTHVELIQFYEDELDFVCEDIFVVVRTNDPGVSRVTTQRHARKNHSYFLVMRKQKGRSRWKGLEQNRKDDQVN